VRILGAHHEHVARVGLELRDLEAAARDPVRGLAPSALQLAAEDLDGEADERGGARRARLPRQQNGGVRDVGHGEAVGGAGQSVRVGGAVHAPVVGRHHRQRGRPRRFAALGSGRTGVQTCVCWLQLCGRNTINLFAHLKKVIGRETTNILVLAVMIWGIFQHTTQFSFCHYNL
jgi:hypothetical protein